MDSLAVKPEGETSKGAVGLNATAPKGSFEHGGGFGSRPTLGAESSNNQRSSEAPVGSKNRPMLDSISPMQFEDSTAPPLPKQMPGPKWK